MPKAEVGSTKWLGNKMKAKGLQRLRWYCQVCERQMRDANGFKQHTLSEGHVRQMQIVGQDANKFINDFSNQFKNDFLQLLRTSHGEKKVNINHFYQEYIANKEHVHMNATKWPSLTEFAKFLGREGICRVEEGDRGMEVSWIDNSPEALRRQAAIQKRERQDKGDEEREQRLIEAQIERARKDAAAKQDQEQDEVSAPKELQRQGDDKIKLSFVPSRPAQETSLPTGEGSSPAIALHKSDAGLSSENPPQHDLSASTQAEPVGLAAIPPAKVVTAPTKLSITATSKPKNVFASATKRNPFSAAKPPQKQKQERPMSEAERIMREELDRKRRRDERGIRESQAKRVRQ